MLPGAPRPCHAGPTVNCLHTYDVRQIQELEEELTTLRNLSQDQAQQIDVKDAEISSLKSQLATWRAVKDAEAASLTSSNKQLADQLAKEIARGRTLESQLSRVQAEWVRGSKQQ